MHLLPCLVKKTEKREFAARVKQLKSTSQFGLEARVKQLAVVREILQLVARHYAVFYADEPMQCGFWKHANRDGAFLNSHFFFQFDAVCKFQ